MNAQVTQARLRELFDYCPQSGVVVRKVTTSSRAIAGSIAGTVNCDGYLVVQMDGEKYMLHRLIWLYVHGVWPVGEVDHRNTVRNDNRLENLRDASASQNRCNQRSRGGSSALKGVYWHRRAGKWAAQIVSNNKHHYLGLFDDEGEAHAAYAAKAQVLHGEFARPA